MPRSMPACQAIRGARHIAAFHGDHGSMQGPLPMSSLGICPETHAPNRTRSHRHAPRQRYSERDEPRGARGRPVPRATSSKLQANRYGHIDGKEISPSTAIRQPTEDGLANETDAASAQPRYAQVASDLMARISSG